MWTLVNRIQGLGARSAAASAAGGVRMAAAAIRKLATFFERILFMPPCIVATDQLAPPFLAYFLAHCRAQQSSTRIVIFHVEHKD
jgi:hypothetical protein